MAQFLETSQVRLSFSHLGLARLNPSPPSAVEVANDLLQKNHDRYHMYFRDVAGHNHIPHSILTVLAMGGGPRQLKRAFDDGVPIQRPLPPVDLEVVKSFKDPSRFREKMTLLSEYTNYLAFFEEEIEYKGWEAVVNERCFSRTPNADYLLSQMYEGVFHPMIHLGFGVEFQLPSIVAEGLAQAASHYLGNLDHFFSGAERLVQTGSVAPKRLFDLYQEVRSNEKVRTAALVTDRAFRVRDGVLGRALHEIIRVASQYQITPDDLERATAEMISCAAYAAATIQNKPGKVRRIDFYVMHNVTCSVALVVLLRQPWIKLEDKVRVLEWKGRLDLVMYAAISAPELHLENILEYKPTQSKDMTWSTMYKAINDIHDDGHIAKFVRALKLGEEVAKPFEHDDKAGDLPVKGNLWFRIAQLCFDTTSLSDGIEAEEKWVMGAGFDHMWRMVPDRSDSYDPNWR
ncbi:hypothetical protein JX265_003590 [Neoarthrinium moseri]|uniref:Oxidoreductase AflY n=1 Tax=Neoarthrinium moseri TaxID=1658444 RepID=A0A9Q0ARY4_9PEZI|nr:hypothetical protein JX266_001228 [Neoarthrinium moseri]KAI1877582.1 hypothetical protein JX265_003590 [Neoarthrinium moseri]